MAVQVFINYEVHKGWLWLAILFERMANYCDNRAVIWHDEKGKRLERVR